MIDLMNPVLGYMACTLLLGVFFGWTLWSFGGSKKEKSLASEVEFWQANLNEARMKRDLDLQEIEKLTSEKQALKQRLAAKGAKGA
ncbi:MAG: hypothetical protein ABJ327_18195 [Litoreibacter sp.]